MKKYLLSAFAFAVAFAASAFTLAPIESNVQLGTPMNAKQAPKEMVAKLAQKAIANRAPKKLNTPVSVASDLLGGYTWNYEMASSYDVDPEQVTTSSTGAVPVVFYDADDAAGTFKIAGMFDGPITATIDLTSYSYPTFTISDEELVAYPSINAGGSSVDVTCVIKAIFYYEGDSQYDAGWYYTDPTAFIVDNEIIWATDTWMYRVIVGGDYDGYYLTPLWKPGSNMVVNTEVNSVMAYSMDGLNYAAAMDITQENYVATVTNFAGLADNPVNITLQEGRTWFAEPTTLFTTTNGDFVLYALPDESTLDVLTGIGTETVLTFDTDWTAITETNYWIGQRGPATITLVGEEFVWPSAQPEPAMYLIGSFNDWDQENMLPMTKDADGKWVVTQEMAENAEFKFRNENGDWFGGVTDGGNFIVTKEQVEQATELELSNPGMNFQIPVAGTWTFTIDPETMKLVIAGEWPEIPVEPDMVYILGEVNGNNWAPNVGVEMATEDNVNFTAEIACEGRNDGYNYFSFTKKLADNADDWNAIAPYRFGAVSEDDFEVTDELLGAEISLENNGDALKIAAGDYTLALNLETMKLVITKKAEGKVGDLNLDGLVDVDDLNIMINIILNDGNTEGVLGNPYLNDDNVVDVADINILINLILE